MEFQLNETVKIVESQSAHGDAQDVNEREELEKKIHAHMEVKFQEAEKGITAMLANKAETHLISPMIIEMQENLKQISTQGITMLSVAQLHEVEEAIKKSRDKFIPKGILENRAVTGIKTLNNDKSQYRVCNENSRM